VALVGARRALVAFPQKIESYILAREVVAHRQTGLEQQCRTAALGHDLAAERHRDVSRASADVDPVEGIARMADDLFVLLEPAVGGVPIHLDVPGQVLVAALLHALGQPYIAGRERVARHDLIRKPDEHGAAAVHHYVPVALCPDPLRGWLVAQVAGQCGGDSCGD
jgi:hypothetical protein